MSHNRTFYDKYMKANYTIKITIEPNNDQDKMVAQWDHDVLTEQDILDLTVAVIARWKKAEERKEYY